MALTQQRKWFSVVIIAVMLMAMLPAAAFSAPSDTHNHWAKAYIDDWVDQGFIGGYPDGTFKPDNKITRAEFMVLVNGAFGFTGKSGQGYSDVSANDWYAGAIAAATEAGYITGYADGTVKPNNPISRQEAAVVIIKVKNLSQNEVVNFKDTKDIASWSKGSIGAAVNSGILTGYPDGTFKAGNPISRAEAVVALSRALGKETSNEQNVFDKTGTYGPVSGTQTIEGNVTVKASGVTLQNTVITGDLIIAKSVGEGTAKFRNVTVKGNTYVYGGGINSIYFIDSKTGQAYVLKDDGPVRIVISGTTEISQLMAQSSVTIQEVDLTGQGVDGIVANRGIDGNIVVDIVNARVDSLTVNSEGVTIRTGQDTIINTFVADAKVGVFGKGTIENAFINANGVSFEAKPENQTLAAGVTEPSIKSSGGGGGGGGSTTVAVGSISLDKNSLWLKQDVTGTLTATVGPANSTNKTVAWTSSNTSVATVTNGLVTPQGAGKTVITATAGSKSAECAVFVESPESDFGFDNGTIISYEGDGGYVVIPATIGGTAVTAIGEEAFQKYDGSWNAVPNNVTTVVIPNSIATIGPSVFYECDSLTEVIFQNGSELTLIDEDAFSYTAITAIEIPNKVTIIGEEAFFGCESLAAVLFQEPSQLKTIGDSAFEACCSLNEIAIPDGVTSIEEDAFCNCTSLVSIIIPDSVTFIGGYAFYGCSSLANIIIPASVTLLEGSVFVKCDSLQAIDVDQSNPVYASATGVLYSKDMTELKACPGAITNLVIPAGVDTIGEYSVECSKNLTSVTLPDSVTTIKAGAFQQCENLVNVIFSANSNLVEIGSYAFFECRNLSSIIIPNSVKEIHLCAFAYCEALTSITIGNGVLIRELAFGSAFPAAYTAGGAGTYLGTYHGIWTKALEISGVSISGTPKVGETLTAVITPEDAVNVSYQWKVGDTEDGTFANIQDADGTTFILGQEHEGKFITVEVAGWNNSAAFDTVGPVIAKTPITAVAINGTAQVGVELTAGLTPGGATASYQWTICDTADGTYANITGATGSAYTPTDAGKYIKVIATGTGDYGGTVTSDAVGPVESPESDFVFNPTWGQVTLYTGSGGAVVIPSTIGGASVTSIRAYAFYKGDGVSEPSPIKSIVIPGTVTEIQNRAFYVCDSLESVTIPDSVTSIGNQAFAHCEELDSATIPENVTTIGAELFYGCSSLQSITVDEQNPEYSSVDGVLYDKDVTTLESYSAGNPRTSFAIPNTVTTINRSAFYYCKNLEDITIPTGVATINDLAFAFCFELESIVFPDSVSSIGESALYRCDSLTSITIGSDVALGNDLLAVNNDFRTLYESLGAGTYVLDGTWSKVGVSPKSSDASLVSIAGVTDNDPAGGSGIDEASRIAWNITTDKVSVKSSDVVVATGANFNTFDDDAFTIPLGNFNVILDIVDSYPIYIRVTAEDGTEQFYEITITRASPPDTKSSDVSLISVTGVTDDNPGGGDGSTLDEAITWSIEVDVEELTADDFAVAEGASVLFATDLDSEPMALVQLQEGSNTVYVEVEAEDGTCGIYILTVFRTVDA